MVELDVELINDVELFQERVDELEAGTSYDEVKHCVATIKKALYQNPELPALSAPQIGKQLRLFVVRTAKSESERFKVFINPIIVKSEGLHLSREMCPIFGEKQFIIPRKDKVHVAFQHTDGQPDSETYIGAYGEVVQQMIQLLDGITLADYGLDLDDLGGAKAFDKATKKDQAAVISAYLDTLKSYSDDLKTEIEADPELQNMNKTIDFMTGLLDGQIKPIKKEEEAEKEESEEEKEETK